MKPFSFSLATCIILLSTEEDDEEKRPSRKGRREISHPTCKSRVVLSRNVVAGTGKSPGFGGRKKGEKVIFFPPIGAGAASKDGSSRGMHLGHPKMEAPPSGCTLDEARRLPSRNALEWRTTAGGKGESDGVQAARRVKGGRAATSHA